MRTHAPTALTLTLLGVMVAPPLVAQTAPFRGQNIDEVSWEEIQSHLETLVQEMDRNPWVSDWQTLVWRGWGHSREVRLAAAVFPRRGVQESPHEALEQGLFIGMIEQTESPHTMLDLGVFPGRTFVWVDQRGGVRGEEWRAILFPLDSSLEGMLRLDSLAVLDRELGLQLGGAFAPSNLDGALHPVFKCELGLIELDDFYWGGQSLAYWSPLPAEATGLRALTNSPEVYPCFVCDRRICCPVDAKKDYWAR